MNEKDSTLDDTRSDIAWMGYAFILFVIKLCEEKAIGCEWHMHGNSPNKLALKGFYGVALWEGPQTNYQPGETTANTFLSCFIEQYEVIVKHLHVKDMHGDITGQHFLSFTQNEIIFWILFLIINILIEKYLCLQELHPKPFKSPLEIPKTS